MGDGTAHRPAFSEGWLCAPPFRGLKASPRSKNADVYAQTPDAIVTGLDGDDPGPLSVQASGPGEHRVRHTGRRPATGIAARRRLAG